MRRGFTLVEALVAFSLATSLFALLYSSFSSGWRKSEELSFRLQALQAAYLVRTRLAADLASYIPGPPNQEPVYGAPSLGFRTVTPEDDAGIAGTALDEELKPITVPVSYEFDKTSHRLYRNDNAIGQQQFERVSFFHEPYEHGGEKGETVGVHLVIVPANKVGAGATADTESFEITFTFHCPQTTLARVYDDWAVYTF